MVIAYKLQNLKFIKISLNYFVLLYIIFFIIILNWKAEPIFDSAL